MLAIPGFKKLKIHLQTRMLNLLILMNSSWWVWARKNRGRREGDWVASQMPQGPGVRWWVVAACGLQMENTEEGCRDAHYWAAHNPWTYSYSVEISVSHLEETLETQIFIENYWVKLCQLNLHFSKCVDLKLWALKCKMAVIFHFWHIQWKMREWRVVTGVTMAPP